jgi:hypothetical protein
MTGYAQFIIMPKNFIFYALEMVSSKFYMSSMLAMYVFTRLIE